MQRISKNEVGMTSLLFAGILVPFIFVMLSVTIDLAHYFGLQEELQRVLDQEAHDALTRRLSALEVEAEVRLRMESARGMATISSVSSSIAPNRVEVSALAEYSGAYFQFLQKLLREETFAIPITARSVVRVQSAAVLIILDRRVPNGSDVCADEELRAMSSFVDRLVATWSTVSNASIAVAVTPGAPEAVDLLDSAGSDNVPRCRPKSVLTAFDAEGVAGVIVQPEDATSLARRIEELSSPTLLEESVERRGIVFLMRSDAYNSGYSAMTYSVMDSTARSLEIPIDLFSVVAQGTAGLVRRPFKAGMFGVSLREIEASQSELAGPRLISALAQTVTDRIVLEQ